MTKLTNAHSKKWKNHEAALALFFAYYDFCRVHSSIKTTTAVMENLTGHVWSVEELLEARWRQRVDWKGDESSAQTDSWQTGKGKTASSLEGWGRAQTEGKRATQEVIPLSNTQSGQYLSFGAVRTYVIYGVLTGT